MCARILTPSAIASFSQAYARLGLAATLASMMPPPKARLRNQLKRRMSALGECLPGPQ